MPPRRKRRSAEVRNSLRLFSLLAVLAGVNVYVFFFNRGTAPREVLKPSSMVKGTDAKAAVKRATVEAAVALEPEGSDAFAVPVGAVVDKNAKIPTKIAAKVPTVIAPPKPAPPNVRAKVKPAVAAAPPSLGRGEPGAGQRSVPSSVKRLGGQSPGKAPGKSAGKPGGKPSGKEGR